MKALIGAAFLALFTLSSCGDSAKPKAEALKPALSKPGDAYPLATCVVSNDTLGGEMGEPFSLQYEGREVKLCCKSCKGEFDKNPKKYIALIEQAEKEKAQQK